MRLRALVEHTDPYDGIATALALRDAGFAVATCSGPTPSLPCPILADGECSLANRADVIVSCLAASPEGGAVVWCLRGRLPRTPVLTDVEPENVAALALAAVASAS